MKHLILLIVALCVVAEVSALWRLSPTKRPNATSVFEAPNWRSHSKRSANFQFTYSNSKPAPADVRDCFQRAGDILASALNLNVPVLVSVSWEDLNDGSTDGTILGAAAPGRWCDGNDFWYPPALYDQVQNRDTQCQAGRGGTTYDIVASFNSDISPSTWNTDPDNLTPQNGEIDLTTVVLHELIHGLGFQGLISQDNSGDINIQPDNRGSRFDDHIYTGANQDIKVKELTQNQLQTAVTSVNNLWFVMSSGVTTGAPSAFQLYAPRQWEQGSSVYHVSELAVKNPEDQLMLPAFQGDIVLRQPGPIALGVLQSIGYSLGGNPTPSNNTNPASSTPSQTDTTEPPFSSASTFCIGFALALVFIFHLISEIAW